MNRSTISRYTLGKSERLKSRKRIEALFAKGKAINVFPFRIFYMLPEEAEETLQAGFGASSRNFKKATDRNRIKRLIREAYRQNKQELYDVLLKQNMKLSVFFIYTGKELPEQSFITDKMLLALERLKNVK